ncbi:GNAT family N-acetyltransferase [Mycolicibacterium litorale]|uniref:GNAT family N-acetyltransferase n=1 Tax=Mycolicibacterium litorale TaxID=758802 RepID=UPI003CE80E49
MSDVDTTMHVDLIEPTDGRWRDALATIRHDFYHLPDFVSLESSRLGGTALAAYVDQPGVRLLLPLVRRAIPGSDAFDLVSPYGYSSPIAHSEDVALVRSALSAVVQTLRDSGFVSMFVRRHPVLELPDDAFAGLGGMVEHGQTVSINLRQSDSEQWHGIRRDHRASLNRSERLGHRAFMDDTGEHLDRFIALYLDTMRRQNAAAEYFYSRDYFCGLWDKLRGHMHLGVVEIDGSIVCAGLFGESDGIVQYHLSGNDEQALKLSPMKTLINHARQWATRRGAEVLHLGGGVGGAQDSLMLFKAGFSDSRHPFKTWRVVLDEQQYKELSGKEPDTNGFFPAYREQRPHNS